MFVVEFGWLFVCVFVDDMGVGVGFVFGGVVCWWLYGLLVGFDVVFVWYGGCLLLLCGDV